MKKIIATAVLTACAAVVTAQTVTSANIVGYAKDVSDVGLHISGMQFENDATNTPTTVYGDTMGSGSTIYKFNGTDYDTSTYAPTFVPGQGLVTKWSNEIELGSGDGYWVEATVATNSILSGEVPSADSITNEIAVGLNLVSYPYPVDRVVTNLGFAPVSGDTIYVFNGTDYDTSTYAPTFVPGQGLVTKWSDEILSIEVATGFWYETTDAQTWVAEKPFE